MVKPEQVKDLLAPFDPKRLKFSSTLNRARKEIAQEHRIVAT